MLSLLTEMTAYILVYYSYKLRRKNSTPLFRCLVLQSMQSLWLTCSDEWWRQDVCHVL